MENSLKMVELQTTTDFLQIANDNLEFAQIKLLYDAKKPSPKMQSIRTVKRRKRNKETAIKLMNFNTIYKELRAVDFKLSNRFTSQSVTDNIEIIKEALFSERLTTDKNFERLNLLTENELEMRLGRLVKVLANKNFLKCFMTDLQREKINEKVWSITNLSDIVCKCLLCSESVYTKTEQYFEQNKKSL